MSTTKTSSETMSNYRWIICSMLFFATAVNYLDRQVLSLTWKDFIAPEFHWTDTHYGTITAIFSIVYAIANLFAGRFVIVRKPRKFGEIIGHVVFEHKFVYLAPPFAVGKIARNIGLFVVVEYARFR